MSCIERQQGNTGSHLALEKRMNYYGGWVIVHATSIGVEQVLVWMIL